MTFKDKVAVITGGAHGIGSCVAASFREAGARAVIIDIEPGDWYTGDLADKQVLEDFAAAVIAQYGHVDYLVNNALPLM